MDTSPLARTPSEFNYYGDRGSWAARGRRITDPANGRTYVALSLPIQQDVSQLWQQLIQDFDRLDSNNLYLPQTLIHEGGRPAWVLYDDLPHRTFSTVVNSLGGGVQEEVLPVVACLMNALAEIHDRGYTLRRLALRDVVENSVSKHQWSLMLTPDSGIRPFQTGREAEEVQGDLIMVALIGATLLTGRRPSPGRIRSSLSSVCPTLPAQALDALDALLEKYDHPDNTATEIAQLCEGHSWAEAARAWARDVDIKNDDSSIPEPEENTSHTTPQSPERTLESSHDLLRKLSATRGQAPGPSDRLPDAPSSQTSHVLTRVWSGQRQNKRDTFPRKSARRSITVAALTALAVFGVAGATAWNVGMQDQHHEDQQHVVSKTTGSPQATPYETDTATEHLKKLVTDRATALRNKNPEALKRVYTPESPQLEADLKTLESLTTDPKTGKHAFSDLTMTLAGPIEMISASENRIEVHATVKAQGIPPEQKSEQKISAILIKDTSGWRLRTVSVR